MKIKISILVLMSFLSFGCSKTIYLSNIGRVERIGNEFITISFPCENSKRPDCYGYADFNKKTFPFAYLGQEIILTNKK